MERMKIIFGKDSYFHVERAESQRIQRILDLHSPDWLYLHEIARLIQAKRLPTQWSLLKLAGARAVQVGEQIIARDPLIIQKDFFNQRSNFGKRYLRPSIRVLLTKGESHK